MSDGAGKTEQVVTPWEVSCGDGGIDYQKLIEQFGSTPIDDALLKRIEKVTGKRPHHWLRKGIFYSHRDLEGILDLYERGVPFYLYTGRGASSGALHLGSWDFLLLHSHDSKTTVLGHLIPFLFCRYLAEAFDAPLVIQLTDDEKFLWKDLSMEEVTEMAYANAKDIIACGFNPKKTFIFSNLEYVGHMYPMVVQIQKRTTLNQVRGIFGLTESQNIGQHAFPAVQAAPSFSQSFPIPLRGKKNMPCLIPCAIDQDPYFRMTRDIAPRMGLRKPALIHSKFFPSLQGVGAKMSSSDPNSSIFVDDTPEVIRKKVTKFAYSGGAETAEEQRAKGANLAVDIPYQWLTFFLDDDEKLREVGEKYSSGQMLTGEVKQMLSDVLIDMVKDFQEKRALVTDDVLAEFFKLRPLDF